MRETKTFIFHSEYRLYFKFEHWRPSSQWLQLDSSITCCLRKCLIHSLVCLVFSVSVSIMNYRVVHTRHVAHASSVALPLTNSPAFMHQPTHWHLLFSGLCLCRPVLCLLRTIVLGHCPGRWVYSPKCVRNFCSVTLTKDRISNVILLIYSLVVVTLRTELVSTTLFSISLSNATA